MVSDLRRYRTAVYREWVALDQSQRIAEAMLRHPAGKGRLGIGARTIDEVLADGRPPEIDEFEETVHDLLFEVAAKIVDLHRG